MSKFVNLNRVLILSPHSDDAEYSVSGTISKFKETMFYVLTMSSGGNFDDSTNYTRFMESENFWKTYDNVTCLDPAGLKTLSETPEDFLVNLVDIYCSEYSFDAIMCPPSLDSHFEHRMVHNIARAVCRFGSKSLIEYNTPSTYSEWVPNVYVDVTYELPAKKHNLKQNFVSQLNKFYFNDNVIEDFHSDFFSSKRGLSRTERFKVDFLMT